MASNPQFSTALRNAWNDALTAAIGASGFLDIYAGTEPANVGTAITTQTLLAHLPLSSAFAPASSGGVLTANAITTANAVASGTASFFRLTTSAGTAVGQGTVGTSSSDLNLVTTTIVSSQPVSVSSFTYTQPGA